MAREATKGKGKKRPAQNPYIGFVLSTASRVLSQIDRDSNSPTFGCCDRNFWHYKMRDFPSAILQQAGLSLALLYSFNFDGNIYYRKEEIKDIAVASARFLSRIQHRDGSFDEYWPNEHGFPPTVFALNAACDIYSLLRLDDELIRDVIKRAANYISKTEEKAALNQEVAAVSALYKASVVLASKRLRSRALLRLKAPLKKQDEEGWFPEYGGADFAYLTVSLNFMADIYLLSEDEDAKGSMIRMIDFLKYFVHPDGSFGGDYGSRNTDYFLPFGFEVASGFHASAGEMISRMLSYSLKNYPVDDRYLCHYISPSFVKALVEREKLKERSISLSEAAASLRTIFCTATER
jgi:hypothetical protein